MTSFSDDIDDYSKDDKKKLKAFIKKIDDKIKETGRYRYYDDKLNLVAAGNNSRVVESKFKKLVEKKN